jgi:hypothetical protein
MLGTPKLCTFTLERLGVIMATDQFQPALGQEATIVPVPTGETQYRLHRALPGRLGQIIPA